MRREDAVVQDEVYVRVRDQRGELFEELQGLEDQVAGAIGPRGLERQADAAGGGEPEAVLGQEGDVVPAVTPYVKIKFPTADSDGGLGTGEFDETVGVGLAKRLVERLFGYLSLSYTFIGDPPGSDLRDSFGWSIGAAYAVLQPLSVFAFLEGATAIAPGQDDPVEVRVGGDFRLTKALKLPGAVTRG